MDIFTDWLNQINPQFFEFHIKGNLILLGLSLAIYFNYKKPALIKLISSISIIELILFLPAVVLLQVYFLIPDISGAIMLDTFTYNLTDIQHTNKPLLNLLNINTGLIVLYLIGLIFLITRFLKQYATLYKLSIRSHEIDSIPKSLKKYVGM